MRLSDLPIDKPVATVMLLVCLMVLGGVSIARLPVDFMPSVKAPRLDVEVPFPGSHPLEALREVGEPLEDELALVPGVKRLRTTARAGRVEVEIEARWSINVELLRLEAREAVERARPNLPDGVGHIRVEEDQGELGSGSILQGRISAQGGGLDESWELLDKHIRRPLERVRGVARVDLYGIEQQQVRIDLDFDALERHGVEAAEVLARVQEANRDLDLGAVRAQARRFDVRAANRLVDVETIADLDLRPGVRVGDVARVHRDQPTLDYGRHLNRRFAVGIDVYREPTANTVETVQRLLQRVEQIQDDPQLEGISLLVWQNAGEEILGSLRGLRNAGLQGGVLAVLVLFVFLRSPRRTLIVAVAIPFSLVTACGAMFLLGSQFNVLTLLGLMLGVGMLVDNAVVVIENIDRLQGEGLPPREAARQGVRQVALAVLASTATTVIVWSWLLVTEKSPLTIYMSDVALTICLTVVCSLVLSVTFIPLVAARLRPEDAAQPGWVLRRLAPAYQRLLGWTLRHRALTLLTLVLLAASAAVPITQIEKQGRPRMRQRAVRIHYEVHDPASKEVLEGYVDRVEAWIDARRDELGYEDMYSWFSEGRGTMTMLYLPRDRTSEEAVAALRAKLNGQLPRLAGVSLSLGDDDWRSGGGDGGRRRVSVALHGDDPDQLEQWTWRLQARLEETPGALEVRGPSSRGQREVRVRVDPEQARALGVPPQRVARAVGFAFRGRRLSRLRGADAELEMVLGLPADSRLGLADLLALRIPGDAGQVVPLASLARLELTRTPPEIKRTDRETTTWVSVEFDPDALNTEQAQARVEAQLAGFTLPEGYRWDFGSWGRERKDILGTMLSGVSLSMLVVMLLMAALFESLTQPLAIVITLPLAFFGGFWALWLGGYELDAVAFIGVIILIGIVVNNGIVMVDHVNALRRAGAERVDALREGCGHRLRPVLMTAISTVCGLIPLALSGPTVAGAYIDSLGVAVIGGLATSTVFTLIGLPVWYATVEDIGALALRALPRPTRSGTSRAPAR